MVVGGRVVRRVGVPHHQELGIAVRVVDLLDVLNVRDHRGQQEALVAVEVRAKQSGHEDIRLVTQLLRFIPIERHRCEGLVGAVRDDGRLALLFHPFRAGLFSRFVPAQLEFLG